jgi:L-fuconolactonase
MKIDAHQHFWKYDPLRDCWITDDMSVIKRDFLAEDLFGELRANGVDACIAVQADQSENETVFLLDLAERHRFIAGVVGWVDLCAGNVRDRLHHFSRFPKLCGFRHIVQAEPDDRFLLREDFSRGIACLKEFRFTYDILIYPKQLPAATELAEKFPEQRFVIDHLAKPLIRTREIAAWSKGMRAIAASPNVYGKLSGLITEADWRDWRADDFKPYLDVVFEAFGTDRLMFGSDWPVCLVAGTYQQVRELIIGYTGGLSAPEKEKIFGMNAAQFYGWRFSLHGPAIKG